MPDDIEANSGKAITAWRNAKWVRADHSMIDMETYSEFYGWQPYTARQVADDETEARLWEEAIDRGEIAAYVAPPPAPYTIAKTTPWLRMTDEEAELITGAMQQASARLKGIYDAASYLSSADPLWSTLHDMISATLGSSARADELLAPET